MSCLLPPYIADLVGNKLPGSKGGLKTGEFVSKYRIPDTRVGCVFCDSVLDTTEHLFTECPGLTEVREIILESVERIGATVDRTDRQSVNEMCCAGLARFEENKELDRGVFRVVATAYAIVLCRRNQHMFADQGAVLWSLLINIDAKSYVTRSCTTNILQTTVKTK